MYFQAEWKSNKIEPFVSKLRRTVIVVEEITLNIQKKLMFDQEFLAIPANLLFIPGNVNGEIYLDMLENNVIFHKLKN